MSQRRHHDQQQQKSPPSGVSDEDALRALLSSAEERAREREGNNNKDGGRRGGRGRWGDKKSSNGRRDNDDHSRNKSKWSGFSDPNNTNELSYYGPNYNNEKSNDHRRHQKRSRIEHDATATVPLVESEDTEKTKNNEKDDEEEEKPKPQYKPNFGLSGALAKDMQSGNVYKGVLLKFKEPPEARAPNTQWRFYVFKKGHKEIVETLHVSKQSAYLMGRNSDIADIPMHHPSLSSQHAVLQYRALPSREANGRVVCQPYIMDLESTNGTFLNGIKIDPARYYQLKKGDVLTFGASTREYVLLTENTTST